MLIEILNPLIFYGGRLCFSDFGLVKYPKKENITPKRRDVGAKFTMAPEMRRHASEADGMPADIYSLAKTLWIFMTGQEKGFDGQYNPNSTLSIKEYCSDVRTTKLDNLLVECTDNNPLMRPTAEQFKMRFKEWVEVSKDFHSRNLIEWLELQELIFPAGVPAQASWTDIDSICAILAETSKIKSLNHMFFPTGGGQTLTGASIASERDMLALHTSDNSAELLKPKKLTYESFGLDSQWNYFRLEAENIEPTGVENAVWKDGAREELVEIEPGKYIKYDHWEINEYRGEELPDSARPVARFLKGAFVIFSTRSIYNRISGTYDARHNKMTEEEFRNYIEAGANKFHHHSKEKQEVS